MGRAQYGDVISPTVRKITVCYSWIAVGLIPTAFLKLLASFTPPINNSSSFILIDACASPPPQPPSTAAPLPLLLLRRRRIFLSLRRDELSDPAPLGFSLEIGFLLLGVQEWGSEGFAAEFGETEGFHERRRRIGGVGGR